MINIMHCFLQMMMSGLLAHYTKKDEKRHLYLMWSINAALWAIMTLLGILYVVVASRY